MRAGFIDEASGAVVPAAERLDHVLALVAEDAEALGCRPAVEATRVIVEGAAGADFQIATFEEARRRGLGDREALAAVVDRLAAAGA